MAAVVSSRRGEPVGAIVLIAVGLLLLMSTLGILDVDWIGRGWPVLLLLLGFWLLVRRVKQTVPATAIPAAGVPRPPSRPVGQPLAKPAEERFGKPYAASPAAERRNPFGITQDGRPDPATGPGEAEGNANAGSQTGPDATRMETEDRQ